MCKRVILVAFLTCIIAAAASSDEMGLLWQRNAQFGIYSQCQYLRPSHTNSTLIVSSLVLNPPFNVSVNVASSDTEVFVDSKSGDVTTSVYGTHFSAVEQDDQRQTLRVTMYRADADSKFTSLWSKDCTAGDWLQNNGGCGIGQIRPIITRDNVVVLLTTDFFRQTATVLGLYSSSGNIAFSIPIPLVGYEGWGSDVSADGSLGVFLVRTTQASTTSWVLAYDLSLNSTHRALLRDMAEYTIEALCMSPDKMWLALGYQYIMLYYYNSAKQMYEGQGMIMAPNSDARALSCVVDNDSKILAIGWVSRGTSQSIIDTYTLTPQYPTPLRWRYTYVANPRTTKKDAPWSLSVMASREKQNTYWIVVGGWGDGDYTNPQVELFREDKGTPVAVYETTGSIFAVDVTYTDENTILVTACGKYRHANDISDGGNLYSLFYRPQA